MTQLAVPLSIDDLMMIQSALREVLATRLRWFIKDERPPDLEFEIAQQHTDWSVNAYLTIRNTIKDILQDSEPGTRWLDIHTIPEDAMAIFNQISDTKDWHELGYHPLHPVPDCGVCAFLWEEA